MDKLLPASDPAVCPLCTPSISSGRLMTHSGCIANTVSSYKGKIVQMSPSVIKVNPMPYTQLAELPCSVKDHLPKHAQAIYTSGCHHLAFLLV